MGLFSRLLGRDRGSSKASPSTSSSGSNSRPFDLTSDALHAWDSGDTTAADKLFRQAVVTYRKDKPDGLDYVLGRYGAFLSREGRLDEAFQFLNEAIGLNTDIPAIWGDYLKLLAQRRDVEGMFAAVDLRQAIPSLKSKDRDAETLLHHARAASRSGDHEFAEALALRVMNEAVSRRDKATRWAAAGDVGQILERADRLPEAMKLWGKSFAGGSDDPTTANRLSMNLERARDFQRAADVCRDALERGLPANVEEQLRKRLVRCEAKVDPDKKRTDVAAYSIRYGDDFLKLGFQLRVKPPVKDLEIVADVARCFGTSKKVGTLVDIDLASGQEVRRVEGLPDLDDTWFTETGWGIGIERTARISEGPTDLTFIGPDGQVIHSSSVPDATSEIAAGPDVWYVGCRNGRLYGFDLQGRQRWSWETPGARAYDGDPYFRPCPYYVSSNGAHAVIASMENIYAISANGKTLWHARLPNEHQMQYTYSVPIGDLPDLNKAHRTLGLAPPASLEDMKRAYLSLAKKTHPDLHPDDPRAAARFRDVQAAYEAIRTRISQPAVSITVEIGGMGPTASFIAVAHGGSLVGSSHGRVYLFDTRGHVRQVRALGESQVVGALRPDGNLVAAWCDGVLSFFQGDAVVNVVEVPEHPGRLEAFGDDLILWHGNRIEIIDKLGHPLWVAEFPKRLTGVSAQGRSLVTASGNLTVFQRAD